MNTSLDFHTAKFIRDKGYNNETAYYYNEKGEIVFDTDFPSLQSTKPDVYYDNPTIADVVMWIYEKHNIWISVDWMTRTLPYKSGFFAQLRGTNISLNRDNWIPINDIYLPGYAVFDTPKAAYIAAITHVLNKLI